MSDAHDARRDGPSPPDDGLSASEKLVERWLQCMPLEREVEKQECLDAAQSLPPRELERRGLGLHKLYIASSETALFGRVLLTLQLSGARPLPPTRLSSGTMVALRSAGAASGKTHVVATVSRVTNTAVSVALEETPDEEDLPEPLTLHLLYNDVTYRRCEQAVGLLRAGRVPAKAALLCGVLLGEAPLTPPLPPAPLEAHQVLNRGLNAGQLEAVAAGLAAAPVCLIHGPPGTGKTTAVVELIKQAVARGERVLATAASNTAVDNMAERLLVGRGALRQVVRLQLP